MTDDSIVCQYVYSTAEFRRALLGVWKTRLVPVLVTLILCGGLVIYLSGVPTPDANTPPDATPLAWGSQPTNLIPPVLLILFLCFLIFFRPLRAWRKTAYFDREMTYKIDGEQIQLTSPLIDINTRWAAVVRAVETRDGFFLFTASVGTAFHWLPKSGLESPEVINEVRALVGAKVRKFRMLRR